MVKRRSQWHPTPVLLPGKSHGRRSLVGCSPRGCWESDTTEQLHFHFSLSCIGEGNGNPLQCSCLENPRDGEPGGLPSMGSHRVRHDWSDLAAAAASGKESSRQCRFHICIPYLVRDDPPCPGAAKPVCHNYWALEPGRHSHWSLCSTSTEACSPYSLRSAIRGAIEMRSLHAATRVVPAHRN